MNIVDELIAESMNKSFGDITYLYALLRESCRQWLSRFLIDTNEQNKHECFIILETHEDCGLSDLEKPTIVSIYQDPIEGIIWFEFYGCRDLVEFEHMDTDSIYQIIEGLED